MTGPELRAIRLHLGLTLAGMGRALALSGTHAANHVAQWERGARAIPAPVALLAAMYGRFGVPDDLSPGATPETAGGSR